MEQRKKNLFLLKGHEDLRLDEKAIQLFNFNIGLLSLFPALLYA